MKVERTGKMKIFTVLVTIIFLAITFSCGKNEKQESPQKAVVSEIVRYLDSTETSCGFIMASNIWIKPNKKITINENSVLEFGLFEKTTEGFSLENHHSWGLMIINVFYKEGKYFRTTIADENADGEPDVFLKEEILNFFEEKGQITDLYSKKDIKFKNLEPPKRTEEMDPEKQEEIRLLYTSFLNMLMGPRLYSAQ